MVVRRLRASVVVLWVIATIVFLVSRLIGDPARLTLPVSAPPEQIQALRQELGLADPFVQQYGRFLRGVLNGDLGTSTLMGEPVTTIIVRAIPKTLLLAGVTIALALIVAVVLAVWAVHSKSRIVGGFVSLISFVSVSVPEFWLALVLISLLAVEWGLLPTAGSQGWESIILPVATLIAGTIGRLAHVTRRSLIEAMGQDYALHALGDGLPWGTAVRRHALPNSLLSLLTVAGDELARLVAGSVVVETIFAWPGIGYLAVTAIRHRDPYLLVGIVLVVTMLVVLINLLIDLLYAAVDPRVRLNVASS